MMIDVQATNEKLVARSHSIICELTGYSKEEAIEKLAHFKTIKKVLINYFTGVEDINKIDEALSKVNGNIRKAMKVLVE